MHRKGIHIILLLLTAVLLSACSVRRFVPEGKYLIKENKIKVDGKKVEFSKSDLSTYIVQKPYRVFPESNFRPWVYYVTEHKTDKRFWKWINENIGKKPEYFDKNAANNSSKQMEQYLNYRGYFNSQTSNSVKIKERKRKVIVNYYVKPSLPYHVNAFECDIADTAIAKYIVPHSEFFPLQEGDIYNAYKLDEQRDQITTMMRNLGYYNFTRDYITYEVDSNYMDRTLKVTLKIANEKDPRTGTTIPHRRYTINSVSIYPDYTPMQALRAPKDSVQVGFIAGRRKTANKFTVYYYDEPNIRPNVFTDVVQILEGLPYSLRRVSQTYNGISNFRIFNNTSIDFDSVPGAPDSLNLLDCRIMLRQADRHSYTIQAEGTHSDGDLGIKGSLSYTNKNIFHGAEVLSISLNGGLEAQKVLSIDGLDQDYSVFNTRQFGITANLTFPKSITPIHLKSISREYQPKTLVALGYNRQVRYYYDRSILMGSFGYDWKSTRQWQNMFTPIYLNTVKVNPTEQFQAIIDSDPNQRRRDQYTNHLIFGARYSFIYNTQKLNKKGSFIYLRADLESSGNLLSLFNKTKIMSEEEGHHEFFGIRYAQYLRGVFDFRQHLELNDDFALVFRQLVGLGIPYGNSYDMPFERSFYAGGANGLRGWRYRSLGPGSYVPAGTDIERIGDMQLEMNAEFRFPIRGAFKGALFADAGNIWTYHENEALPGGGFSLNTFYKQLAFDAGLGLRIDAKFVIARVDLALPLRHPYVTENGSYWRFDGIVMQFGIGYPF